MRTIVVVGAGDLGGAIVRQIAAHDVAPRVVLVDEAGSVAAGKALDIRQAAPIDGYSSDIHATSDEAAVVGADAVVIADRASGEEWQGDSGAALVQRIAHLNGTALLLCAGARQLELVERGVREAGLSRRRLIGSAPEGLRGAVTAFVALEARCAPDAISLTVLGRPPSSIIVPWEDASVGGRRAVHVLAPPAITRLDARLSRLWPPGPLTLASAAARVLAAAAHRTNRTLTAFVAVANGEGDAGCVGMLPVTLDGRGITDVLEPSLSIRDRVRLETVMDGVRRVR